MPGPRDAEAQRMLMYLSVKLPPGTRRWARRSRRRSSWAGTGSGSGPESAHRCPCSCRETCCTDPPETAWQTTHVKHGTCRRNSAQRTSSRCKERELCNPGSPWHCKEQDSPSQAKPGALLTVSYAWESASEQRNKPQVAALFQNPHTSPQNWIFHRLGLRKLGFSSD